jgi:hypothetical protein
MRRLGLGGSDMGLWDYAGPMEGWPTGCWTWYRQAYCQAHARSRLFASARRSNETTERIPDSSDSTTEAISTTIASLFSINTWTWPQRRSPVGKAEHMVPARELATSKHQSCRD